MLRRRAVIDLSREDQQFFMHVVRSDGEWIALKLELFQGRLILPIDHWPNTRLPKLPNREAFMRNYLG